MSVEAADEQGQSASVLKWPFISDSLWDIPFSISVYSPSSDAVLSFSFLTNFFYFGYVLLGHDAFCFAVIIFFYYPKNSCSTIINNFFVTRSWPWILFDTPSLIECLEKCKYILNFGIFIYLQSTDYNVNGT